MKVNAELINKYHSNLCSPEEVALIEHWLLNGDAEELQYHTEQDKSIIKQAIWDEIEPSITEPKVATKKLHPYWKLSVAASFIAIFVGLAWYFISTNKEKTQPFIAYHNTSMLKANFIKANQFNVAVGPETYTNINEETGNIDLKGSILISPKKDLELNFQQLAIKITLKKGQSYVILNNGSSQGLIVVNEKNLISLPPVIQRKIFQEFDI